MDPAPPPFLNVAAITGRRVMIIRQTGEGTAVASRRIRSAVCRMNIQDLYMAVCIIDPIRDGEITRDRNFKSPPGIIVIRSIGPPHGFFPYRLDDVPERPAVPGRQPFKKFHDFDRN